MSALGVVEREVASLYASGVQRREIAARRSVSVRTVKHQLYRVYQKLGVHDRDALVAALKQEAST